MASQTSLTSFNHQEVPTNLIQHWKMFSMASQTSLTSFNHQEVPTNLIQHWKMFSMASQTSLTSFNHQEVPTNLIQHWKMFSMASQTSLTSFNYLLMLTNILPPHLHIPLVMDLQSQLSNAFSILASSVQVNVSVSLWKWCMYCLWYPILLHVHGIAVCTYDV